ncbi:MAG: chemotaxis protein CheW [Polyangiaceae bacterium]
MSSASSGAAGRSAAQALSGLECRDGERHIVVPAVHVGQIVEVEASSALPLAKPWISGFSVHEGRVLISVALFPGDARSRRGRRKAVLLAQTGYSGVEWALEVSEVLSFVEVEGAPTERTALTAPTVLTAPTESARGSEAPPEWLCATQTRSGREVFVVDVARLLTGVTRSDEYDAS